MATIFYDHLIPWQKLELWVESLEIPAVQRLELTSVLEETIHTETLVVILEHLPQDKHGVFIDRFHAAPHDHHHIIFLQTHAHPEIELKIRTAIDQVIGEIIAEHLNEDLESESRSNISPTSL